MPSHKRHLPPSNVLIDPNYDYIAALCGLTAHADSIGETAFLEASLSARCARCQAAAERGRSK